MRGIDDEESSTRATRAEGTGTHTHTLTRNSVEKLGNSRDGSGPLGVRPPTGRRRGGGGRFSLGAVDGLGVEPKKRKEKKRKRTQQIQFLFSIF